MYGDHKLSHTAYREYLATHLITSSLPNATCLRQRPQVCPDVHEGQLNGKHFPVKFPALCTHTRRKHPTKRCKICNFTQQQRNYYNIPGPKLPMKYTYFTCKNCNDVAMCVTPCFEAFSHETSLLQISFGIQSNFRHMKSYLSSLLLLYYTCSVNTINEMYILNLNFLFHLFQHIMFTSSIYLYKFLQYVHI